MGAFSAYKRRKLLNIDLLKPEGAKKTINDFLVKVASPDSRRLKWIVEACSRAYAEEIEKLEGELVVSKTFNRELEASDLQVRLLRLEEDFRFISAIEAVLHNSAIDEFAREMQLKFGARK